MSRRGRDTADPQGPHSGRRRGLSHGGCDSEPQRTGACKVLGGQRGAQLFQCVEQGWGSRSLDTRGSCCPHRPRTVPGILCPEVQGQTPRR